MPFAKGTSGNPGGRTTEQREREKSLSETLRGIAGPNCEKWVDRLHQIIMNGEDRDAIAAMKIGFERTHGRAPETVQLEGQVVDARMLALVEAARMTPHERRKLLDDDGTDES